MLFLFNSAARAEYVKNVLNTINLPVGAVNDYQYSQTNGSYNYVDDSADIKELKKLKKDDVLISYMDRDQYPFVFYPLRKGKLVDIKKEAGRLYYYVKLGEYVTAKDIQLYNSFLRENVEKFLYNETTADDGTITPNGFFAFDSALNIEDKLDTQLDGWKSTISQIQNCKKIKDENCSIFTRISLKKGKKTLFPKNKGRDWYYRLTIAKNYSIEISYFFVDEDEYEGKLSLNNDQNCISLRKHIHETGNRTSVAPFDLHSDKFGRDSISQQFEVEEAKKSVRFAQKPIFVKVGIDCWKILGIIAPLAFMFVCSVISGMDTEQIIAQCEEIQKAGSGLSGYQSILYCLATLIKPYWDLIPTITAAIKTVCTAIIAWILGKKE